MSQSWLSKLEDLRAQYLPFRPSVSSAANFSAPILTVSDENFSNLETWEHTLYALVAVCGILIIVLLCLVCVCGK